MDIYQAQELFKQLHPGNQLQFGFDEHCIARMEIDYCEGRPLIYGFTEYKQLKITIPETGQVIYVPILPHRTSVTWNAIKTHITAQGEVFLHQQDLTAIAALDVNSDDYTKAIMQLCDASGMSKEAITEEVNKKREVKNAS